MTFRTLAAWTVSDMPFYGRCAAGATCSSDTMRSASFLSASSFSEFCLVCSTVREFDTLHVSQAVNRRIARIMRSTPAMPPVVAGREGRL